MKHSGFLSIAIAMIVALVFSSCDKDNDNDIDMSKVQPLKGAWKIITTDEAYTIYSFIPDSEGAVKGKVQVMRSDTYYADPIYNDYTISSGNKLSLMWYNPETKIQVVDTYDITEINENKMTWFFRPSLTSSSTEHYVYLEKISD